MVIPRQAAHCLRSGGPGLFGVHLPGSGLKRALLHGRCHPSSQNMSPECRGCCRRLVSSGCMSLLWLAGTLVGQLVQRCSTAARQGRRRGREGEEGRKGAGPSGPPVQTLYEPGQLQQRDAEERRHLHPLQPWCTGVVGGCG